MKMETKKKLQNRINGLKSQNSFYLNRYREAVEENIKLKKEIKKLKKNETKNKSFIRDVSK
jgi:hypothetical protein